jgi:8-oxo-dGTP diphosphatase
MGIQMEKSKLTTLCYIEKDGQYLMLNRVSKENDINKDKWIGVGGHFEEDESPEDCLLREVKEETGLTLLSYRFRGIVTFISNEWQTEYMCLYTADEFEGKMTQCEEGVLCWVDKSQIDQLNLWTGDKIFLNLLAQDSPFFSLKLRYEGDCLMEAVLDGKTLLFSQKWE